MAFSKFLFGNDGSFIFGGDPGSPNVPAWCAYIVSFGLRTEVEAIARRSWNSSTPRRIDPVGNDTAGYVPGNSSWGGTFEARSTDAALLDFPAAGGVYTAVHAEFSDGFQRWTGTVLMTLTDYPMQIEDVVVLSGTFVGASKLEGPTQI